MDGFGYVKIWVNAIIVGMSCLAYGMEQRSEIPAEDLGQAIIDGDLRTIKEAIDKGLNINDLFDGDTLIGFSVVEGNKDVVALLLEQPSLDINIQDGRGSTPLHLAIASQDLDKVTMLLEKKPDLQKMDNQGRTPLLLAVAIRALTDSDRENQNNIIHTIMAAEQKPIDYKKQDIHGKNVLDYAVKNKNIEIVKLILQEQPDLTINDDDLVEQLPNVETILHRAVEMQDIDMVRYLLDKAPILANKTHATFDSSRIKNRKLISKFNTPLAASVKYNNVEIFKLLLEKTDAGSLYNVLANKANMLLEEKHWLKDEKDRQEFMQDFQLFYTFLLPHINKRRPLQHNVLDAFLSLETVDDNGAISEDVLSCLFQNIPIVAPVALLKKLLMDSKIVMRCAAEAILSSGQWAFFINKTQDFIVLLPTSNSGALNKSDAGSIEPQFGFSSDQLDSIQFTELVNLVRSMEFKEKSASIANFQALFDMKKPKRFYISGHGELGVNIASIALGDLQKFLRVLTEVNTEFIYINSCESGGENLVKLQQGLQATVNEAWKKALKEQSKYPQYAMVIRATTDAPASGGVDQIAEFFNRLDIFLNNPHWFFGGVKDKSGMTVVKVLEPLHAESGISNLPSVRFPGTNNFFRAVDIGQMTIVTWMGVQRLVTGSKISQSVLAIPEKLDEKRQLVELLQELESKMPELQAGLNKASAESGAYQQAQEQFEILQHQIAAIKEQLRALTSEVPLENIITIPESSKSVLIYPIDLTKITLDIQGNNRPRFISKIGSKSCHFINKIRIGSIESIEDLVKFFSDSFVWPFDEDTKNSGKKQYLFGKQKIWFVRYLEYTFDDAQRALLENVVISVKPLYLSDELDDDAEIMIWYKDSGYKQITTKFSDIKYVIDAEKYDENELDPRAAKMNINMFAYKGAKDLDQPAVVSQEAIFEATAGNENQETEIELYKQFKNEIR